MDVNTNSVRMNKSHGLIIVGMHRSGTSAVARVCNLLGVQLGSNLLPPGPDNPRGYWEHGAVLDMHEQALAALDSSWDDCRALPENWQQRPEIKPFCELLRRIIEQEVEDAALWGVKDPRISRLLPIWHDVLHAMQLAASCLIVLRNPLEVADSLSTRNNFPLEKGLLLWLRYYLDLERHSRGRSRAIIAYGNLLHDWRTAMTAVSAKLEMTWPVAMNSAATDVDAYLTSDLRHHVRSSDVLHHGDDVSELVHRTYQAFIALYDSDDNSAYVELDEVSQALARVDILYDPILKDMQAQQGELKRTLKELRDEHIQLEQEDERKRAHIQTLDTDIGQRDRAAKALQTELTGLEDELTSIYRSKSWTLTKPLRESRQKISAIPAKILESIWRLRASLNPHDALRNRPVAFHPETLKVDHALHVQIEEAVIGRGRLGVAGWAFHEESTLSAGTIIFDDVDGAGEGRAPMNLNLERRDVHAAWHNDNALKSGFRALAHLSGKPPTEARLELDLAPAGRLHVRVKLQRHRMSLRRMLRQVWRTVDRRRIANGFSYLLRGQWRHLWNIMVWLYEETAEITLPQPVSLQAALDLLEREPRGPASLTNPCDIIVPVYNGVDYLEPLFRSIRRNTKSPYRLIVIDDASPDARIWPRLQTLLRDQDKHAEVILLRNTMNKGFVATVNRGAANTAGNFVLLNTDVEVPPLWLERLMAPLQMDRTIASTTPFSNAATVCSFPDMNADNPPFAELNVERIDRWFRLIRGDLPIIELPTGVGFCMGINADIWRQIGTFDEQTFGRGYGEENDWCLRARTAGYRSVMVPNLFVHHKHGGSFDIPGRDNLRANNLLKVQTRHPTYRGLVNAFINEDPLKPLRQIVTMLIACGELPQRAVLVVDHEIGGGANNYRQHIIEERLAADQPVLLLTARRGARLLREAVSLRCLYRHYSANFDVEDFAAVESLFANYLPLAEIFYNNAVSFEHPTDLIQTLHRLKVLTGARLTVPVHDYYPLCPSYNLLNAEGAYCRLPQIETCRACLPVNRFAANPDRTEIDAWRAAWGALLELADRIICFSEDSRKHVTKVYAACAQRIEVRPHAANVHFTRRPQLNYQGRLRIGVVGAIGYAKGAEIVKELARYLLKTNPDARIIVIGRLEDGPSLSNVIVTGPYQPERLPDLLERHRIQICFMPSIWPETFSYVTAELMALDVPIAYFALGAPAERLQQYSKSIPIPVESRSDMALITRLLSDHIEHAHVA